MKKLFILPVLLCLCACDNNTESTVASGLCLRNAKTITTTEQNGEVVKTTTTELFLCKCFTNKDSFMMPQDEFAFEFSTTDTANGIEPSVEYTEHTKTETFAESTTKQSVHSDCDKSCTKACQKKL
jgi:hypothetical protein